MEIGISSLSDKVEIRFIDNGRGIEKENIERIFDENYTTKEKGMGLGLSMAKKYFELLNGSISVESTSPKGTTVLIIIPRTDLK
jgi:signal transduction histidine kinase